MSTKESQVSVLCHPLARFESVGRGVSIGTKFHSVIIKGSRESLLPSDTEMEEADRFMDSIKSTVHQTLNSQMRGPRDVPGVVDLADLWESLKTICRETGILISANWPSISYNQMTPDELAASKSLVEASPVFRTAYANGYRSVDDPFPGLWITAEGAFRTPQEVREGWQAAARDEQNNAPGWVATRWEILVDAVEHTTMSLRQVSEGSIPCVLSTQRIPR